MCIHMRHAPIWEIRAQVCKMLFHPGTVSFPPQSEGVNPNPKKSCFQGARDGKRVGSLLAQLLSTSGRGDVKQCWDVDRAVTRLDLHSLMRLLQPAQKEQNA